MRGMTVLALPLNNKYRYFALVLIAATVVTFSSITLNYRNALNAAENSLELMGLGIAVSLEATLSRMQHDRETLFTDIITGGQWEGIAFLALCDGQGLTLLHSNPNLRNRRIADPQIREVSSKGTPLHAYETLGTGEKVFLMYFPVHIPGESGRSGASRQMVLKLALHTYPAEKIIRQAGTQAGLITLLLGGLWLTYYFLLKTMKHSDAMARVISEREKMAVLGEMASTLAHEIRNPLGSIKGFAQYVSEQSEAARGNRARVKESLDTIVSESHRLELLTDDLLSYARQERVITSRFELGPLVHEVVSSPEPTGGRHCEFSCDVSIPEGLRMTTDRDKLKQILLNVLENATAALQGGKNINGRITIVAEPADSAAVRIRITDTGHGMDPETKKNAFQPFFTTRAKGTGLGLAIVKKLAESLGGRVELESDVKLGTTVSVVVPAEYRGLQG